METFDEEVWSQFYGGQHVGSMTDDPIIFHRLSLMFIVLAIGSLMDVSLSAYNLEAEKYHQLSKAALFNSSLFDEPTINAVQALVSQDLHFIIHEMLSVAAVPDDLLHVLG